MRCEDCNVDLIDISTLAGSKFMCRRCDAEFDADGEVTEVSYAELDADALKPAHVSMRDRLASAWKSW